MKHYYLLTLLLLTIISIQAQLGNRESMMHDGLKREYILYVPANFDSTSSTSVPLLFNIHGYSSSAMQQQAYGDFKPIADAENFLIVHPEGTFDDLGLRYFNTGIIDTVDDIGFIEAVLDSMINRFNIDQDRVYSTGMSNGGYMSYYLACELSHRFAAVASVTGSMTVWQRNNCNPQFKVPIMQIHGTADSTVLYNGEPNSLSMDELMDFWIDINQCDTNGTLITVPDINTNDFSTAEQFVYCNNTDNITTELYKITGGGHTWPGSFLPITPTNYDIDASEEIWDFFSRQNKSNTCQIATDIETIDNFEDFKIYPNPASGFIQLEINESRLNSPTNFIIYDALGSLLMEVSINNSRQMIDLNSLSRGTYFYQMSSAKGNRMGTLIIE